MKNGLIYALIIIALFTPALGIIGYQDYVTDQAGLFSVKERAEIEQLIEEIERNTTTEIAVVTVKSLEGMTAADYAIRTAEKWKVGKKDVDNGLIILIAPNEREYRIEVGYGLEGVLPDSLTGKLGREILVPAFREQKYGEGALKLLDTIKGIIENEPEIVSRYAPSRLDTGIMILILIIFLGAFGLMGYYAVKQQLCTDLESKTSQKLQKKGFARNTWGGPIFFGGRGGGGSGGFGGFGGGSFGGGGSGGGW